MPGRGPTLEWSQGVLAKSTGDITIQMGARAKKVPENLNLILSMKGVDQALFVTDSRGNTYTQMPRPLAPGAHAEPEVKWEQSHHEAIGEPRTIGFSSPTTSAPITNADGATIGSVIVGGVTGTLTLRKNQLARAVLNTVTIKIDDASVCSERPIEMRLDVPNIPTIDGAQPRSWTYGIDVRIDTTCSFSIRRNSMALRSENYH
jgi:hypothetical protein